MSEISIFVHKPKTRHLGSVRLSPSDIANVLQLPEGADIRRMAVDHQLGEIIVVVEHPNLPEVPEDCYSPHLEQIANVTEHVDSDSGETFWRWHIRPVIPGAPVTEEQLSKLDEIFKDREIPGS